MDEMFLGTIVLFAGTYAPRGWAYCDGAVLPIIGNTPLFSLLGTTYGGDGRTTFALPDLRSRVPMGTGAGSSLTTRTVGSTGGAEKVTLAASQMPVHTHQQLVSSSEGTTAEPSGNVLAKGTSQLLVSGETAEILTYGPATSLTPASPAGLNSAGGGQPFDILPPFLGMNYIICVTGGVFPPRP